MFVLAIACVMAAPAPKPYIYTSYAGAPLGYSGYSPYTPSAYSVYPSLYSYSPYSLGYSGYGS